MNTDKWAVVVDSAIYGNKPLVDAVREHYPRVFNPGRGRAAEALAFISLNPCDTDLIVVRNGLYLDAVLRLHDEHSIPTVVFCPEGDSIPARVIPYLVREGHRPAVMVGWRGDITDKIAEAHRYVS